MEVVTRWKEVLSLSELGKRLHYANNKAVCCSADGVKLVLGISRKLELKLLAGALTTPAQALWGFR
ncbi:hypothetical protein AAHH88_00595 [Candidatus Hodgkinia cicadicola]